MCSSRIENNSHYKWRLNPVLFPLQAKVESFPGFFSLLAVDTLKFPWLVAEIIELHLHTEGTPGCWKALEARIAARKDSSSEVAVGTNTTSTMTLGTQRPKL